MYILSDHCGIEEEDLFGFAFETPEEQYHPAFFVCVDKAHKEIIVSIR